MNPRVETEPPDIASGFTLRGGIAYMVRCALRMQLVEPIEAERLRCLADEAVKIAQDFVAGLEVNEFHAITVESRMLQELETHGGELATFTGVAAFAALKATRMTLDGLASGCLNRDAASIVEFALLAAETAVQRDPKTAECARADWKKIQLFQFEQSVQSGQSALGEPFDLTDETILNPLPPGDSGTQEMHGLPPAAPLPAHAHLPSARRPTSTGRQCHNLGRPVGSPPVVQNTTGTVARRWGRAPRERRQIRSLRRQLKAKRHNLEAERLHLQSLRGTLQNTEQRLGHELAETKSRVQELTTQLAAQHRGQRQRLLDSEQALARQWSKILDEREAAWYRKLLAFSKQSLLESVEVGGPLQFDAELERRCEALRDAATWLDLRRIQLDREAAELDSQRVKLVGSRNAAIAQTDTVRRFSALSVDDPDSTNCTASTMFDE